MPSTAAPLRAAAERLLDDREPVDRPLAERLRAPPHDDLPELIALAHRVRLAWMGPAVEVESIISAKTGGCPEDCTFCSQSARYTTEVVREPMLPSDRLVELARQTRELGGTEFCIVVAVRGPDERMMRSVIEAAAAIRAEGDIEVAASLGFPQPGPGRAPPGGRLPPLQPHPRGRATLLPADLHHPHLRGPGAHLPRRRRR